MERIGNFWLGHTDESRAREHEVRRPARVARLLAALTEDSVQVRAEVRIGAAGAVLGTATVKSQAAAKKE